MNNLDNLRIDLDKTEIINNILNRTEEEEIIKEFLLNFENSKIKNNETPEIAENKQKIKRGLFLYGESGCGKTKFIMDTLTKLNYDVISYDASDVRNKSIIDTITEQNMSDKNVMSILEKKIKKIAIVMDEIDGMNNGDKGGINSLISIIRPKKNTVKVAKSKKNNTKTNVKIEQKEQENTQIKENLQKNAKSKKDFFLNIKIKKKKEIESKKNENTVIPIICIGNYHMDKKITDLTKVCTVVELKKPTNEQMSKIVDILFNNNALKTNIMNFIHCDLRKLNILYNIYKDIDVNDKEQFINILNSSFHQKLYNENTKEITKNIINNKLSIEEHGNMINETDRTTVGLIWHENVIDVLEKHKKEISIPIYLKFLDNICFADYIDRIIFQKQIWTTSELTSIIKTFKNNKILHESIKKKIKYNPKEIRFTKVLTKYATEYSNIKFIQNLCQKSLMDKNDLIVYFCYLKKLYPNNDAEIYNTINYYDITDLEYNRMYKYALKYITYCDKAKNIGENDNEQENDEDPDIIEEIKKNNSNFII
jgi:hypothetical protein